MSKKLLEVYAVDIVGVKLWRETLDAAEGGIPGYFAPPFVCDQMVGKDEDETIMCLALLLSQVVLSRLTIMCGQRA